MKVAVVHNGNHDGVINRFGQPCAERYSLRHVNMVVQALREMGHTVALLEADVTLLDQLRRFLRPEEGVAAPAGAAELTQADPIGYHTSGMVFNMAYGIQGDARYTHLPAMLEMAGVPYTGASPQGHVLALDKVITKIVMASAGVPTPAYQVMEGAGKKCAALPFPLVVKPRHESTSYGLRLVGNQCELDEAVEAIGQQYQQEALVEQYIDGREVCIGLVGNDPVEFLPPVELDFGERPLRLMTWDDKYHKRADEPRKVCPAPLEASMVHRLNELALATFRLCNLRDYARVDIRMDRHGSPLVLEINSMASLGEGGSYVTAAKAAGYDFRALVKRILDVAHQRYFGTSAPADTPSGAGFPSAAAHGE